jgi:transposase
VNKTDANDAEGLAHLVRAGWYREVRVKGRSAMLAKALLGARSQLLSMSFALENQIRGILKTFGRIVPKGAGGLPRTKPWEAGPSNAHHAAASCQPRRQPCSRHIALDREDC